MAFDLNMPWSPSTPTDKLLQRLTMASSLGYTTIALSHTLELPLPPQPKNPFPTLASTHLPAILHRATLPLGDPSAHNFRLSSLQTVYDILAVRPLTEQAFQSACLTLDVPLISLDLTSHFPFHFRPKSCMAAVSRGVRFEVSYAQLLSAGDQRARANFISNVTSLVRATRGRGILISSEARSVLALRAPADVVNLLSVWGLPKEKGVEASRSVPRSVVVNEGLKRTGFRGVINVVQPATRPEGEGNEPPAPAVGAAADSGAKATKSQKRKNGQDGGQQVSRRQAKKMRVLASSAG